MDGTRTRMVAISGPLALACVLGVAALCGQPAERPSGGPVPPVGPALTAGPLPTPAAVVTDPTALFGLPRTTPARVPVEPVRPRTMPAPAETH